MTGIESSKPARLLVLRRSRLEMDFSDMEFSRYAETRRDYPLKAVAKVISN
jgi:hypothetical protein